MTPHHRLFAALLVAALWLSPVAALAQPATGADASNSAAPANATAPTPPPVAAQAPPAPAAGPLTVALVITPEFKAIVWNHDSALMRPFYAQGKENNIGQATADALVAMLQTMGLNAQVVASTDEAGKVAGAAYTLAPTIQRYEQHNEGITTFAPFTETMALQWTVTDSKGANVLLDTVLGSATGHLGNNFIANSRAQKIENDLLADVTTKSTALLKPVLVGQ